MGIKFDEEPLVVEQNTTTRLTKSAKEYEIKNIKEYKIKNSS